MDDLTEGEFVSGSALLGNITLLILLTACANVSILLLGRAVTRRPEIAIRLALGARRGRVVQLLLVESVMLALVASAGGILVGHWICEFFNARFPGMGTDYALGWRSVTATLVFAAATGIGFGLTPALHATRSGTQSALKSGFAATDRQRSRLQRVFVVAEVAISMALVCAGWLLVNAFIGGVSGRRPYELSNRVLIADLDFARPGGGVSYTPERADALLSAARERIAVRPGVDAVSFGTNHPLGSAASGAGFVATPEQVGASGLEHVSAAVAWADPDYFRATGIRLVEGRDFARTDSVGGLRVAIVGEGVASQLWPDRRAVGNVIMIGVRTSVRAGEPSDTIFLPYSVVGVAPEMQTYGRRTATYGLRVGSVYLPRLQLSATEGPLRSRSVATLLVRTSGPATDYAPAIVQEIRALDAELTITGVTTTGRRYFERNIEEISLRNGVTLAGVLTLFMACVGVYAVIAFGVNQRAREIGIRMALGARRSQVVALFFRDGMWLALIGFAIGVPLSLIAMRIALGGESGEILTAGSIATVVVALLIVAALASWLPARRAAAVDPMIAAKSD
jgi:predicted permease